MSICAWSLSGPCHGPRRHGFPSFYFDYISNLNTSRKYIISEAHWTTISKNILINFFSRFKCLNIIQDTSKCGINWVEKREILNKVLCANNTNLVGDTLNLISLILWFPWMLRSKIWIIGINRSREIQCPWEPGHGPVFLNSLLY